MEEGWNDNEYLILYALSEIAEASERYAISKLLPGYEVVGLRGWDDFILRDAGERTYSMPTVPVKMANLSTFQVPNHQGLRPDSRFQGKIKWYIKPLVFGGEPQAKNNIAWVSHEQHAQLVLWWNKKYRSLRPEEFPQPEAQ